MGDGVRRTVARVLAAQRAAAGSRCEDARPRRGGDGVAGGAGARGRRASGRRHPRDVPTVDRTGPRTTRLAWTRASGLSRVERVVVRADRPVLIPKRHAAVTSTDVQAKHVLAF